MPTYVNGGWYVAASRDEHAVLRPAANPVESVVETSRGWAAAPGQNILYLDLDVVDGRLCVAGTGHTTDGAYLWNDARHDWLRVYAGRPYGTSPCKFGPHGLYVSVEGATDNVLVYDALTGAFKFQLTKPVGARGIALVTGAGDRPEDVHGQDGWYGRYGFGEYVERDGLRIGQGIPTGLCARDGDGPLVTLAPGGAEFVRWRQDGTTVTATAWQRFERRAVIVRVERAEIAALPPATDPVPAVGRPHWLCFFMFANVPLPPGNGLLAVRNMSGPQPLPLILSDETVGRVTGRALGYWCAAKPGEGIEDVERRARDAAAAGYRPVAYWDGRRWPRKPLLPSGSWCCVQAYCGFTESLAAFEASVRDAAFTVASYGYDVALVAQCSTDNASLTKDIAALVPAFARIAQAVPRAVAKLPFTGAGRQGGLADHPEVRPLWEQFAAGITTPQEQEPIDMPVKPTVTVKSYAATIEAGKAATLFDLQVGDTHVVVQKDAGDNVTVSASNAAGSDKTGAVRHVSVIGPTTAPPTPGPAPEPTPLPSPIPAPPAPTPAPTGVTFGTFWGTALGLTPDGRVRAVAPDKAVPFEVRRAPDGRVGLKARGCWVSAEADGSLTCTRVKPDDFVPDAWEAFKPVDRGDGKISLLTDHDRYVAVEQGGAVVADRQAASDWELLTPSGPLGPARAARSGLVRGDGKKIVDGAGAFFPLGASFFCALWGWKHYRDRARRSFAFLAEHGADYYRAFFEVGGPSWEDRTIDPREADYEANAIDMVETAWREFGLRVEPTVFAGGTGADPDLVTDKLRRIFEDRQELVLHVEGANEAWQNFTDHALLRRQVQKIRSWFGGLVATSAPQIETADLLAAYTTQDADVANFNTLHTERGDGDGGWRAVRQPWDAKEFRTPGSGNEPPGLQSSGAMLSDPLRLAMLRAVGIMCGLPAFVLHTGAGVRWGGAADLAGGKPWLPRKANFWEYPEFGPICDALRNAAALVPEDAPNWTKTRHGADHTDHPLRTDDIWPDGIVDHGVVRIHAAYGGNRFVVMPIGVKQYADLHARDACRITVSDPVSGATVDTRTLAAGEVYRLVGAPDERASAAYIINGER